MTVTNTWSQREQRVLEAVLAVEEADGDRLVTDRLAESAGLTEPEARHALLALIEDGYVSITQSVGGGGGGPIVAIWPRLRGKGRRAVGQWPADAYDALLTVLQERIDAEPDPAERSKLERLLSAVAGMGRDVLVDVLGATIKHAGGL